MHTTSRFCWAAPALTLVLLAPSALGQVLQPAAGESNRYPDFLADGGRQVAFDHVTGDYMGARMRNTSFFGDARCDLAARSSPQSGLGTRWFPVGANEWGKNFKIDIVEVLATDDHAVIAGHQDVGLDGDRAWILSRRRNSLWSPPLLTLVDLGVTGASTRILDIDNRGGIIFVLGEYQHPMLSVPTQFLVATSAFGGTLYRRTLSLPSGVRFHHLLASGGSLYFTGVDEGAGSPVVARMTEAAQPIAAMRYDSLRAPFAGVQPGVMVRPGEDVAYLASLDAQERLVVMPLTTAALQPTWGARTLGISSELDFTLRDAVRTDDGHLHILFGANAGLFSGAIDTQVLITGTTLAQTVGNLPTLLFTLAPESVPVDPYLIAAGPMVAVAGPSGDPATSSARMLLTHSTASGNRYPCAEVQEQQSAFTQEVEATPFDIDLNATGGLIQPVPSTHFSRQAFLAAVLICS